MSEWITDRLPTEEDTQITNEQELGGFEHWTPEFQAYFEQWLRTEYVPRVIQYYLMKYVY